MSIKLYLFMGLIGSFIVGIGEFFLHFSPMVLENNSPFEFFKSVPKSHLTIGHFLSVLGIPFYFFGYLGISKMLKVGHEGFAFIFLLFGFFAFTVGGIWISSRIFIGEIIHLESEINTETYQNLKLFYDTYYETLVKILRVIIILLSLIFSWTIYNFKTMFPKWMMFFNPIIILLFWFVLGAMIPRIGIFIIPILMNITHFIFFGIILYQLKFISIK